MSFLVCRSHEQQWLSLLPRGRLLVLKGGLHQFMLQPGIVDIYRQQAISFASSAQWGKAGEGCGSTAPGGPASQAEGGDVPHLEAAQAQLVSQDGVALLAGPDGQAVIIEKPAAGGGVGVGEVVKNLWAQCRNKNKSS
jgi:hypothetical protein